MKRSKSTESLEGVGGAERLFFFFFHFFCASFQASILESSCPIGRSSRFFIARIHSFML